MLPHEKTQQMANFILCTINSNGNIIVTFDENPVLNSLVYDVEFPDGAVKNYVANVISENVLIQVDSSGFYTKALDKIVLHRKLVNAVSMKDEYVNIKRGVHKLMHITIGWEFLIERKDGSCSWMFLKVLKESNPIEVAEYATTLGLENEPDFSWWMLYTLKKRDRIIYLVNRRFRKRNHKFGIQITNNMKESIYIDENNGNTLWQDAYAKEMYQVGIAFKILQYGEHITVGYNKLVTI